MLPGLAPFLVLVGPYPPRYMQDLSSVGVATSSLSMKACTFAKNLHVHATHVNRTYDFSTSPATRPVKRI